VAAGKEGLLLHTNYVRPQPQSRPRPAPTQTHAEVIRASSREESGATARRIPGQQPGGYPPAAAGGYPQQQPGGNPGSSRVDIRGNSREDIRWQQPTGYPQQQPGGYQGQCNKRAAAGATTGGKGGANQAPCAGAAICMEGATHEWADPDHAAEWAERSNVTIQAAELECIQYGPHNQPLSQLTKVLNGRCSRADHHIQPFTSGTRGTGCGQYEMRIVGSATANYRTRQILRCGFRRRISHSQDRFSQIG